MSTKPIYNILEKQLAHILKCADLLSLNQLTGSRSIFVLTVRSSALSKGNVGVLSFKAQSFSGFVMAGITATIGNDRLLSGLHPVSVIYVRSWHIADY